LLDSASRQDLLDDKTGQSEHLEGSYLPRHDLTKSRITLFEQCPKRLWLSVHRKDLIEIDDATQARFDTGNAVGMISLDAGFKSAIDQTATLIASGDHPIFEATFQHEGVLVRVDVMHPDGDGSWHVAEVKSSASRKDYHIADLATQVWVLEGAGVEVASASIRHINSKFEYTREGDFSGLLVDHNSDEDIRPLADKRSEAVEDARKTLQGAEPDIAPGSHCDKPFACDFKPYCFRDVEMPRWPISILPRSGKRLAEEYAKDGLVELDELTPGELKTPLHERIREATVSGIPFHDWDKAREMTQGWSYPRIYLDFETIGSAIPRWIGTRPFQQIPFQYSMHIENEAGEIEHRELLCLEDKDPRRDIAEALLASIPPTGSIITYNAKFERGRLKELADRFEDLSAQLQDIIDRVVDLEPVARQCWYHRDQRGSWSIKYVLPSIPGMKGYDELDVQDGMAAQRAYLEALGEPAESLRREKIAAHLREYCAKDTEAMIGLLKHLLGPADQ
jgi:CRISPR/Cas system-associated exonuclease Cas4 (RecB family)